MDLREGKVEEVMGGKGQLGVKGQGNQGYTENKYVWENALCEIGKTETNEMRLEFFTGNTLCRTLIFMVQFLNWSHQSLIYLPLRGTEHRHKLLVGIY